MVEVGQLEIAGTVNTKGIEQGFKRVKNDFKGIENQANQTNASLGRAGAIAGKLGKTLIGIGVAGVGALTALATKSPALATTMAKLQVTTLKLSNTVGRQMSPAFEGFNYLLGSINSALQTNEGLLGSISTNAGQAMTDLGNLLSGNFEGIDDKGGKLGGILAGAVAGSKFGPWGAVIGGALGYVAGGKLGSPYGENEDYRAEYGSFGDSIRSAKDTQFAGGTLYGMAGESFSQGNYLKGTGEGLKGAGAYLGGSLQTLIYSIMDVFEWAVDGVSEKEKKMSYSTGVTR